MADGNFIAGNFVGTDATGLTPLGNVDEGIGICGGTNNVVGGATPGMRNVISGACATNT